MGIPEQPQSKPPLDQFGTFEVFVQPKEGKPFQHEGAVHAPNLEMAYVLAKETFTRRFVCTSLFVVLTQHVAVSPFADQGEHVFTLLNKASAGGTQESYEIFALAKRGKQHTHVGKVQATSAQAAMAQAESLFAAGAVVINLWAARTRDIRFTSTEEKDFWTTLPEKKFRDASDYKGGDKLKEFLERTT
ncbi:phenylacetic acid degradation b [Chryseolinea sp. Jin1]|uniref:Phenylacetic acid degradation b n=1 Tax=Chryseolinea lacunae TaxID=2801331 RepID=A0ABS1KTW3_9BACT|nr:phenylacetic acid degradation b [Chryseolinea lacunae]